MRWLFLLLLALGPALPACAGDVAATEPSDIGVTIYRDPGRNGGSIRLDALGGFAVITETRRVTIPAGRSRLRFIGVADGIIPESAIVTGLPGGVIEKNRDAALLSPSSLMRAARGKLVTLKRTNRDTGKAELVGGQIVSASDQGVIFQTAAGVEALRCSGMAETFRYGLDAEGLSAQPTLSVQTKSAKSITATVTLTYIAEQFDWSANYTAQINSDGKTMELGGWITLANGNSVSLNDARTQIVAGGLNREYVQRFVNNQPQVIARCWPMQRTSDVPLKPDRPYTLVNPYVQPAFSNGMFDEKITVTAQRRTSRLQEVPMPVSMMAAPAPPPPAEQLGDLKLYTVPQRTTVAALQMKQTRLVEQHAVPFERIYKSSLNAISYGEQENVGAVAMLRTFNDKAHNLGLPLPSGSFLIAQEQFGRTMLVGEPNLADTAEAEKIELVLGQAPDVTVTRKTLRRGTKDQDSEVTISNAGSSAIAFELELNVWGTQRVTKSEPAFGKRNGRPLLAVTVPANATMTVQFTSSQD